MPTTRRSRPRSWPISARSGSTARSSTSAWATATAAPRCSTTVRTLDAAKLDPTTLVLREPTLDDVFLELTGHVAEQADRERRRGDVHRPPATEEEPMTTIATTPDVTVLAPKVARPHVIGDALVIAWRNLVNIRRNPQLLVFATIQPVIFILNFRYVFGGAINTNSLGGIAVRELLDARDLRADGRVRRAHHGSRPRRRLASRDHRAVQVAARSPVPRCSPGARRPTLRATSS